MFHAHDWVRQSVEYADVKKHPYVVGMGKTPYTGPATLITWQCRFNNVHWKQVILQGHGGRGDSF